jgi:hypothetical protein
VEGICFIGAVPGDNPVIFNTNEVIIGSISGLFFPLEQPGPGEHHSAGNEQ